MINTIHRLQYKPNYHNKPNIMDSLIIEGQLNLGTISSNNEDISHLSLVLNTYNDDIILDIGVVDKLEIINIHNYYTTIYKSLLDKVVNNGKVIFTNVIASELDCRRFKKVTLNRCAIPIIIRGDCEVVMDNESIWTRKILAKEFTVDDDTYNGHCYIDDSGRYIKNGKGTMTYANRDKYEGEWKIDQRDGQGTMTYANGDKYEGEWIDDQRHGQGTMTYANGDKYVGGWLNEYRDGQGTMTYANGDIYEGEWYYEKYRNGQGTMTYANGDIYEGEWYYDVRHIQGTMTYANGDKYEGGWINDQRHGKGTMTYTNGDKYVGGWRNDRRYGRGTMSYANGERYVGEWRNDQRHGKGTMTYANGERYVGEWRNDERQEQ
jgi:hypothetical protein